MVGVGPHPGQCYIDPREWCMMSLRYGLSQLGRVCGMVHVHRISIFSRFIFIVGICVPMVCRLFFPVRDGQLCCCASFSVAQSCLQWLSYVCSSLGWFQACSLCGHFPDISVINCSLHQVSYYSFTFCLLLFSIYSVGNSVTLCDIMCDNVTSRSRSHVTSQDTSQHSLVGSAG